MNGLKAGLGQTRMIKEFKVSLSDLVRLDDGCFLNDTLIDAFLCRLAESSGGRRVHAFSSLFFSRLVAGGWPRVSTWTNRFKRENNAGIFAHRFLLMPVHDPARSHWWLAVVCYPWAAATSNKAQDCFASVCFLDSMCGATSGNAAESNS